MDAEADVQIADPSQVFQKYKDSWYQVSAKYWSKQEKNDNGMLGGFPELSECEMKTSNTLIQKYQKEHKLGNTLCADCGAGIGRVSIKILANYFSEIDLIDPVESFLKQAQESLSVKTQIFPVGIQDWKPEKQYDLFWIQWAIMYLTDDDAVAFLKRCRDHLTKNGIIVIKDNLASRDKRCKKKDAQFFVEDRGIARSYMHYYELFREADLTLIEYFLEPNWNQELLPLACFVLSSK